MTRIKFLKRKTNCKDRSLKDVFSNDTLLWIVYVTLYRVCKFCADLLPVKIWKYYYVRCELPAQITWGNVPLSNTTTTNHAAWLARERRGQPPWNTTTPQPSCGQVRQTRPQEDTAAAWSVNHLRYCSTTTTNHTAWLWLGNGVIG